MGYLFAKMQCQTANDGDSAYRDSSESYREHIASDRVVTPKNLPRILLVDDDPTFGKIMKRAAVTKGVDLTFCASLDEFATLQNWDYDVVMMDYDLGAVTGVELTKYIEQFTKEEVPVILVSQTNQQDFKRWPGSIREFVHKRLGPYALLDATFEAHEVHQICKKIRTNPN